MGRWIAFEMWWQYLFVGDGVGGARTTLEIKYYGKIKDDVLFYCNVCSDAFVVVGLELLLCNDKIYLES